MFSAKIVIAGGRQSGKSAVVNQLVQENFPLQNDFEAPPRSIFKRENGIDYTVIDCASGSRYRGMDRHYLQKARFLIYCVDISKEFSETVVEDEIQALNAKLSHCPDAQVILVGTKKDNLCQSGEAFFEQLQKTLPDYPCFLTSARNNEGFNCLKTELNKTILEQSMQDLMMRYDASKQILEDALTSLPDAKKNAIKQKLVQLKESLTNKLQQPDATFAETDAEIQQFVTDCEAIIEEKNRDVLKAIQTVAVLLGVACAISLVGGYALGFVAGAWFGFGALFAGLFIGGASTAGAVVGVGLSFGAAGGLAAFGVFSTPAKETLAVRRFAETIAEQPDDPLRLILGQ